MEHVDVDGLRIAYTRAGAGPPLVMLHGAPSDSRTWQWMLPDLARDHTRRSRGTRRASGSRPTSTTAGGRHSSPTPSRRSSPRSASSGRTSSAIRSGRWSPSRCSQRHPAVPASLVLVGGYAGWAGSLPPDEVARRLEMFVGMAELGDAFDPKSYPGLFSDLIPADRGTTLVSMMRDNIRPATISARPATSERRPTSAQCCPPSTYRRSSCMVRPTPARRWPTPKALHAAIPTSRLVVLPKLGHACMVEDPEACAAEIRKFVKTVA